MTPTKEKAAISVKTEAAFKTSMSKCDPIPSRCAAQASPSCSKAAAIAAYNWQVLSLEACTRLFRQHPEWRAA